MYTFSQPLIENWELSLVWDLKVYSKNIEALKVVLKLS